LIRRGVFEVETIEVSTFFCEQKCNRREHRDRRAEIEVGKLSVLCGLGGKTDFLCWSTKQQEIGAGLESRAK